MILVPPELQSMVQRFFAGEPIIWTERTLDMAISIVQEKITDASREEVLQIILEHSAPAGHA